MKKLLSSTIIGIFCFVALGWAWWHAYVVLDETGEPVEGAAVHACSGGGSSGVVYTNADGRWVLSFKNGMIEDEEYDFIWAQKMIGGKLYANFVPGGVYHHLPHVQKDTIRLIYPAPNYPG